MKKLVIIAVLIAMVSPAMAVQIIGPSPTPSGAIDVMMTIDRWAEMLLPDEIVLESTDPYDPTANWTNGGAGGTFMYIKANYDLELAIGVAEDLTTTIVSIGTFSVDYMSPLAGDLTQTVNGVSYDIYELDVTGPAIWVPLAIYVELSGTDLSAAPYSPTAVKVAEVSVTVLP